MRTRLLCACAVLAVVCTPARATELGDFPYPITERPLVLGQEILEAEGSFAVRYFSVKDPHYDDWAYPRGAHLGTIASTLRLAAGLTDWLQVAGTATLWWAHPEIDLVKPTLELAGLPVRWVAPRVRVTLPDARSSKAFGYAFGVMGRYAFLDDTVDAWADLDVDRYAPPGDNPALRPTTTLSFLVGARWSFVSRFYVGAHAGLSSSWVSLARTCAYGEPSVLDGEVVKPPLTCSALGEAPAPVFRYGLEAGFTSAKHIDVVLSWGVPADWTLPTDMHPAFRIHVVTFTVRVRR